MKRGILAAVLLAVTLSANSCMGWFSTAMDDAVLSEEIGLTGTDEKETEAQTDGVPGDVMETEFFNFTIDDPHLVSYYGMTLPKDGQNFLVVWVQVENTYRDEIEVYDTDFQLYWQGGEAIPLVEQGRLADEFLVLPISYDIPAGEETGGLLIYEVPETAEDFSIVHQTIFEDESLGELYRVSFTPELRDE